MLSYFADNFIFHGVKGIKMVVRALCRSEVLRIVFGYIPVLAYDACRVFDRGITLRASDRHNARTNIRNPFSINRQNAMQSVGHKPPFLLTSQNGTKKKKINRPWQKIRFVLEVDRIHQRSKFQAIPPLRCQQNARKPQIWPVIMSQNSAKMSNINGRWPEFYQAWRWSGYTSAPNFRPFLTWVITEMPRTSLLTSFTRSKWCQNQENQYTMTKTQSFLKVLMLYQHTKFQAISLIHCWEYARKSKIWPISLGQSVIK